MTSIALDNRFHAVYCTQKVLLAFQRVVYFTDFDEFLCGLGAYDTVRAQCSECPQCSGCIALLSSSSGVQTVYIGAHSHHNKLSVALGLGICLYVPRLHPATPSYPPLSQLRFSFIPHRHLMTPTNISRDVVPRSTRRSILRVPHEMVSGGLQESITGTRDRTIPFSHIAVRVHMYHTYGQVKVFTLMSAQFYFLYYELIWYKSDLSEGSCIDSSTASEGPSHGHEMDDLWAGRKYSPKCADGK